MIDNFVEQNPCSQNSVLTFLLLLEGLWGGVGGLLQQAEVKLHHKLKGLFMGKFKKKSYKKWHTAMREFVIDKGVGDLRRMGYGNYKDYMGSHRDHRVHQNKPGPMRGVGNFSVN